MGIVACGRVMADNPPMIEPMTKTWEWPAAVIMARVAIVNRWANVRWEADGVVRDSADPGALLRVIGQTDTRTQTLYPGYAIRLHRDESEGYHYQNRRRLRMHKVWQSLHQSSKDRSHECTQTMEVDACVTCLRRCRIGVCKIAATASS